MKKVYTLALASLLLGACAQDKAVNVTVTNTLDSSRTEMVELSWNDIKEKLSLADDQTIIVLDGMGQQVEYQLVNNAATENPQLIFQTTLEGKQGADYTIKIGVPETFENRAKSTFMPRRKDDMSWENDRVAYRMYGPALEVDPKELLVSGAIDIWCKKTPKMVTQQWYQDEFDGVKTYHTDAGEGCDFYKSGRTLGAGAAAPFANDSLYYITHNFKSYDILENGPLRTVFALTFEPYHAANGVLVNETRTISLDAGSNLNKITVNYGDIAQDIQVAAGFPYYQNENFQVNAGQGFMTYGQPAHEQHGVIYLGVVADEAFVNTTEAQEQLLAVMNYPKSLSSQGGLTYYSGGGWDQGGFETQAVWDAYVIDFAKRLRTPLQVSVK